MMEQEPITNEYHTQGTTVEKVIVHSTVLDY